ncbi:response regulator [Parabacteroides sp. AM25-14]|nr:response regulator [Parabacteroides sp. AM25-14]RGD16704.1 response regulator [Parabacteroides sp. AM25-14]
MVWEENSRICLHMQLIAILSRIGVLMDVQMPHMDGYEATRCIRALGRSDAQKVPIFAMTANAFAEDVQKSREAGMNAHISKPLNIRAVYKQMNRYLQG